MYYFQKIESNAGIVEQNQYSVDILLDSINKQSRLTTFKIELWRPVLAEFNTHRGLSRNSPSSRAISVDRLIKRIRKSPAMPVLWGVRDGAGMQAKGVLDAEKELMAKKIWLEAMESNIKYSDMLREIGVHQQIANRLLEPFMKTTIMASATDWANFIFLRNDWMAQPEIQVVSEQIYKLLRNNKPTIRTTQDEWHLPFVSGTELEDKFSIQDLQKISAGKSARVSYYNFNNVDSPLDDIRLADNLLKDRHLSPFEHQAVTLNKKKYMGNFYGWMQLRKFLDKESNFENFTTLRYKSYKD